MHTFTYQFALHLLAIVGIIFIGLLAFAGQLSTSEEDGNQNEYKIK